MKRAQLVAVLGIGLTLMGLTLMSCSDGSGSIGSAGAQTTGRDFVAPTVFQAAGPNIASIQNTVDQYRAALGATNNDNAVVGAPRAQSEATCAEWMIEPSGV